ncbi:Retrovirus-related Pol polyprotein from transposon TNT 1-94 [Abeliophyllum distichum]|uniref:Retrovirus-related Pol polyprotein from transposon TNT 1-94 n=1 Tax=Abeliophyllum distichum TaxID=126358 RepID=A0ABD1V730_9LAMI
MPCLKTPDNQVKESKEGESSIGKKIQTEVKRLDVNQEVREPEQIDPQVETEQEEVLEQPELEISETVVPNQEQLEDTNLRDYQLVRDKEKRQVRPNLKYTSSNLMEFVLVSDEALELVEPFSYEEAVNWKNYENWKKVMREEIHSLAKNDTWKLVETKESKGSPL